MAASGVAQAATFTASNEAELITAINAANASTDPSSTITLTSAITATSALPTLRGNVTITTNANISTSIGSAAGASLNLQDGANYIGNGLLGRVMVGSTANTTGTLTLQGGGTGLSTISLRTLSGQSNISVLDGAVLTTSSGTGSGVLLGGATPTAYSGGSANVLVSGAGSAIRSNSVYIQHAGTLEVSDGGTVQAASTIYLGAQTGSVAGVVSGAGSTLTAGLTLALGAHGSATLTVSDGGTVSAGGMITMAGIGGAGSGVATLNIGAAAGSAPAAPGTVIASAIDGGPGTPVLNFNHNASAYNFSVPIVTTMNVNQIGSGTTTLTAANTYTGATRVTSGILRAGSANVFSPSSAHTVATGGTLDLAGFDQQLATLTSSGTVSTVGNVAGTTLTVVGPYASGNGTLRLGAGSNVGGTVVGDRLVLDGAAATPTGQTQIEVVPLPGMGGLTSGDGILLVNAINGATTTAQTTRDAFSLVGGKVDSGAFEYRLHAGDAAGAGENWYLRSAAEAYRQEVALVAAAPQQLRQADLAMLGNLHLRTGALESSSETWRQGWARFISTDRITSQAGVVSPGSKGRLNGVQIGIPLWDNAHWTAGMYVGQLKGSSRVSGLAGGTVGAVGKNDLDSMYLGGYATHRRDSGLYVDSVLQSAWHRVGLRPELNTTSTLKGRGLLASVEVGQPVALGSTWVIEPQVQLSHQHLDMDDTALPGRTTVRHDSDNGWTLRVGARIQGVFGTGMGRLQPYGRLNFFTTASATDRANYGTGTADSGVGIDTLTGGQSTELAVGATLVLSKQASLYGELGQLWASGGHARMKSGLSGSVGVMVGW